MYSCIVFLTRWTMNGPVMFATVHRRFKRRNQRFDEDDLFIFFWKSIGRHRKTIGKRRSNGSMLYGGGGGGGGVSSAESVGVRGDGVTRPDTGTVRLSPHESDEVVGGRETTPESGRRVFPRGTGVGRRHGVYRFCGRPAQRLRRSGDSPGDRTEAITRCRIKPCA